MWWRGLGLEFQKLIKRKHPFLYDVSCICHLTNLTIKACLEDVDQLFVDVFYNFFHSSKWKQEFPDHWCSLFTSKPSTILKHCPTHWLRLCEIHPICHSSERVIKKAPENSTLASAEAGISPYKKLNMSTACIEQLDKWYTLLEKGRITQKQYSQLQEKILSDIQNM